MDRRQVLITGAAGVIGRALTTELTQAGYSNVRAVGSADADLTRADAAYDLFDQVRPALVFHLAARVYGIMGNRANKAAAFLDNTRININVIDAAQRVGVGKIVAMGSVAIYSDVIPTPMQESTIWDGPPHDSEAAYAHSKRAMYAQLEAYKQEYGLDFAYCISTNLYGPHDRFDERWGHVIPSLISKFYRAITAKERVTVWGSGAVKRDFLYSGDAARALRLISEQASGPLNVASGNTYTIRETVEVLKQVSGYGDEVDWDTTKPEGQRQRDYDISRLAALGFKPSVSLEEGLETTFNWFRDNVATVRR